MDLEVKLHTGGISRYARIQLRIRPGCPAIDGSLVDQDGNPAEAMLLPALAALEQAGTDAGQTFQVHVERVWVHPIDTRPDDFERLLRGAVRLASRYGLGGDRAWGEAWSPARWFRVRCVRP